MRPDKRRDIKFMRNKVDNMLGDIKLVDALNGCECSIQTLDKFVIYNTILTGELCQNRNIKYITWTQN
jgi:hypothetical protein